MPYLSCPSCGLTITEAAARSPYQACPRCTLRRGTGAPMRLVREPARLTRAAQLERVAQVKSRLGAPLPDARSA